MMVNRIKSMVVVLIVLLAGGLVSCSKGPDPRLTLCQDLGQLLLDGSKDSIEWTGNNPVIKGYQDLEMRVYFTLTDPQGEQKQLQASCFYPYEQDEIGAETFEMPTAAYSTYPSRMILDGQAIDKKLLAQSINKVMIMQGKQAIKNLQEKINQYSREKQKNG